MRDGIMSLETGSVMSERTATAEAADHTAGRVTASPGPDAQVRTAAPAEPPAVVTVQDVLVEEVSIDGMCGVY
jgi:mycofactocin precursor